MIDKNLAEYIGQRFTFRPPDPDAYQAKYKRDVSLIEFELVSAPSTHDSGLLYSRIDLRNHDLPADLSFNSGDNRYPDIAWPTAAVRVKDGFFITGMPLSVHGDDQLQAWAASQQNVSATLVLIDKGQEMNNESTSKALEPGDSHVMFAPDPNDISEDELLSCPFCGDKPQLEQNGKFEDVACLNIYCLVQPRALGAGTKAARETWNTRVQD